MEDGQRSGCLRRRVARTRALKVRGGSTLRANLTNKNERTHIIWETGQNDTLFGGMPHQSKNMRHRCRHREACMRHANKEEYSKQVVRQAGESAINMPYILPLTATILGNKHLPESEF